VEEQGVMAMVRCGPKGKGSIRPSNGCKEPQIFAITEGRLWRQWGWRNSTRSKWGIKVTVRVPTTCKEVVGWTRSLGNAKLAGADGQCRKCVGTETSKRWALEPSQSNLFCTLVGA
jgi:hypothetical protein